MNKKQNVSRSARFKQLNTYLPSFGVNASVITLSDASNSDDMRRCPTNECPLNAYDNECWMNLRGPNACPPDPWSWFVAMKNVACRNVGGTPLGNLCYLPCARGYNTLPFTCTGWKSKCVNWGIGWTGCVDTYLRDAVTMWSGSTESDIRKGTTTKCANYWNEAGQLNVHCG